MLPATSPVTYSLPAAAVAAQPATIYAGPAAAQVTVARPVTANVGAAPLVAARPASVGVQPVAAKLASAPQPLLVGGNVIAASSAPAGTSSASLLAMGRVISERVVPLDECYATGRVREVGTPPSVPTTSVPATLVSATQAPASQVRLQQEAPSQVQLQVQDAWDKVHEMMGDPDGTARVPKEWFVEYCMSRVPNFPKLAEYEAYLNTLFDTGTSLMLPAQKTDLGRHCFGYVTILANEFYFEEPADLLALKFLKVDQAMPDQLGPLRQEMDADWSRVEKDGESRVTLEAFVTYFLNKFGPELAPESFQYFESFLVQNFQSALAMMLGTPPERTTLGGHCFRYAALMAGEFYFDAANKATTGQSNSVPVKDITGIAKKIDGTQCGC